MPGKIPVRLRDEFVAAMDAADDDNLPDGAWFQKLEETAKRFIRRKKLQFIHANDAVHQWVKIKKAELEKTNDAQNTEVDAGTTGSAAHVPTVLQEADVSASGVTED